MLALVSRNELHVYFIFVSQTVICHKSVLETVWLNGFISLSSGKLVIVTSRAAEFLEQEQWISSYASASTVALEAALMTE